jgi:hypothetical protein
MLDFELHDTFKVCIKIPKAEFNVNDLVSCCKSLSKSLAQSFFEKILYELQAHILNHYLGAVWNSNNSIPTPWECRGVDKGHPFYMILINSEKINIL